MHVYRLECTSYQREECTGNGYEGQERERQLKLFFSAQGAVLSV